MDNDYVILTQDDLLEAFDNTLKFQLSVLNEVYFGKTKGCVKIEKLLDNYRNKYMGKTHFIAVQANEDKLLLEINREFEKEFGFSEFAISVIDSGAINAFTLPIGKRYDVGNTGKQLAADAKTFKFKKEAGYAAIVCIYAGLIFNPNYSTEEIMAIIMHEIGHNFQEAISGVNLGFTSFGKVADIVTLIVGIMNAMKEGLDFAAGYMLGASSNILLQSNLVMKPLISGYKYAIQFKDSLIELYMILSGIGNIINDIKGIGLKIADTLTFGVLHYLGVIGTVTSTIKNPFGLLALPSGYRHERTADNFPTFYGYAPALSSAMNKMGYAGYSSSDLVNTLDTIPVYSTLMKAFTLPAEVIMTTLDPHPMHLTRIQDQINLLEAELKKPGIDPKMRKRIQKDIDAIKPAIKDSTDITKGFKDPDLAKHALNKVLYAVTGGTLFRDILLNQNVSDKRYAEYDKAFDTYVKQVKK